MTVDVETRKLRGLMVDLHDALISRGNIADAATILEDETRLLLKQLITLTPPPGLGTVARKQGEQAIARDLRKIFTPVEDGVLNNIGSQYGVANIDQWITNAGGEPVHLKWDRIDPTGDGMSAFHRRQQNRRGRTRSGLKGGKSDAWRALYVVAFEDFTAYRNKIQARVGRMKAGWAVSYKSLGGTVQRWIERHLSTAPGYIINNLLQPNSSIQIANGAPGISQIQHIANSAVRVREQAISRRIKLVISGYARDVAAGLRIARKTRRLA